ncbi:MAG: hypothetical protein K9I85_06015 [Saprospiraceae bacterium]|nr:hypothetical protein [Saprospiraceae bacterium]
MTTNQNENLHKGLAYLNTILLTATVFFLTRMVGNIDKLSDNVVTIRVEMAKMQSAVEQNRSEIYNIKLKDNSHSKSK